MQKKVYVEAVLVSLNHPYELLKETFRAAANPEQETKKLHYRRKPQESN